MKRNWYSVRHIQRVRAMAQQERRLRLRMATRSATALCILGLNLWAIITWPGVQ